jgi:hypothetical protein
VVAGYEGANMADRATERQKAVENAERYVRARDAGHIDFMQKAQRCEDFFAGYENKQWDEATVAKLRSQRKPVLTINKIFPTLGTAMGEQLQNQVDVSFRASSSGDPSVAAALDKVWMYIANNNMLDWVRSEVADDGFIKSRGFYDVRMDFKENLTGDVVITKENSMNVVIDPDATEYDPDKWKEVFVTKWLTGNDIRIVYGKEEAAKILEQRGRSTLPFLGHDFIDVPIGSFGMDSHNLPYLKQDGKIRRVVRLIERQYKEFKRADHFVDPVTGESRLIPENWGHDRISRAVQHAGVLVMSRRVEVIRWTVSADDFLLFDEESPYRYFTLIPYFPYMRDGETIGLVENLISPQENLNKTRSQELHIVNTTANSGWKVKQESLKNMTLYELELRGAETGLVLEMDDINNAEKINPNQVPTGLDRISFKSDEDIKQISNIGDSHRGLDRADVSGIAIERKQIRGAVNLAKPFSNLIRTDHMLAKRVLHLIQTFMTEPRVLTITGRDPNQESEQLEINMPTPEGEILNDLTLGEYSILVSTVPAREKHEDTQFDEIVRMRTEMGIDIPDSFVLKASRLTDKQAIMEALESGSQPNAELQALEIEQKKAEIDKLKTDTMARKAEAVERVARAQKTSNETESNGVQSPEMAKLQLERDKMEQENALKIREQDMEDAREREKMRRQHSIELAKLKLARTEKASSAGESDG